MWEDKPDYKINKVMVHQIEYAGESPLEKYKRVRKLVPEESFKINKNVALLIIRLDDIACKLILNLFRVD